MSAIEDQVKYLEGLYATKKPELELSPIEKWMVRELNVTIKDTKGGSAVPYAHPILKEAGKPEIFTVHMMHGKHKKKRMITRLAFRKYLYPNLLEIVVLLAKKGKK